MGAPFKVGDRVALKPDARPGLKYRYGRVIAVEWREGVVYERWTVRVKRDEASKKSFPVFWDADECRPLLIDELFFDQVAQDLADAVKRGETHAAMALADRVMELCGGTKTGGTS